MTDQTLQAEITKHPVYMYLNGLTSDHSRRAMMTALRRTLAIALEIETRGVDAAQVFEYPWPTIDVDRLAALRGRLVSEYEAATAAQTISAIKGVMGACFDLGMIDADHYMRISRYLESHSVKIQRTQDTGRYVKAREIHAIATALSEDDTPAGKRDHAIIGLMWYQGPRISEVVSLDLSDYDQETGHITIREGKGGKSRLNQVRNSAKQALDDWIEERGDWAGPLFSPVDRWGNAIKSSDHLSRWAITKMLHKRARQAGVDPFSPHDLRRTAATELIAMIGVDKTRRILGHADISTTILYDRSDLDDALKAAEGRHYPYVH